MSNFAVSETVSKILKNFSQVSNSVLLREGNQQRTMVPGKSVLVTAEFPEAWPRETGIYDLSQFLGTMSLFKQPELTFGDDAMTIEQGKSRIKYRYSDPSTIKVPPDKTLKVSEPSVEFVLTADALTQIIKTCNLLSLDVVTLDVDTDRAQQVIIRAGNSKNLISHAFQYDVEPVNVTAHEDGFEKTIVLSKEHVAFLLDGNYTVSLAKWAYAYFRHQTIPITYHIVGQTTA